jgi:uracil-DNA glycosylase
VSGLRHECLKAMGIPVWVPRARSAREARPDAGTESQETIASEACSYQEGRSLEEGRAYAAALDWEGLAAAVRGCTRCGLHKTRTQTVFGVGRRDAALLIIGEAPGAEEDRQGEPFVGPAGQLLNTMLRAIGLKREEVYIANILKCRPPNNRDPQPEEAVTCTPYLERQIALIRPRAILALGRIAGQWLLQSELPLGRLRGRVLQYGEARVPLVVTYHPAYLLRSPLAKAKSWQDLCLIREVIETKQ